MPKNLRIPTYRLHKPTGQGIVVLNGRTYYLGKYGTPESQAEYDRRLSEWLARQRRPLHDATPPPDEGVSVGQLILAYWRFVGSYYVKHGKATSEQATIRCALRFVRQLYGNTPAHHFTPLKLKAVREAMIRHPVVPRFKCKDPVTGKVVLEQRVVRQGLARRYINKQVGRIRRMFAWAVEEELVPVEVHTALQRVKGLKKGKSMAREKPRVRPVPDAHVDAVLPYLPPAVRGAVEIQRLCGGRPQDVLEMRAADIDRSGAVWQYRPGRFKTEHYNEDDSPDRERVLFLGPRAQQIFAPFLEAQPTGYLFSPRQSEQRRATERRRARQTKFRWRRRWPIVMRSWPPPAPPRAISWLVTFADSIRVTWPPERRSPRAASARSCRCTRGGTFRPRSPRPSSTRSVRSSATACTIPISCSGSPGPAS